MKNIWHDIRYGSRMLWRSRGFTAVAVLTLGLGIGANAAIFSVINSVLLNPYPYKDPDRLLVLRMANMKRGISDLNVSYADYTHFKERNKVFEDIALISTRRFNLSGTGEQALVNGAAVSAGIFNIIGGQALLGRTFAAEQDRPGGEKVVVLGQGLWRRSFGADEKIVGQSIRIDGTPHTVVGVVAPGAQYPDTSEAELFVPLAIDPAQAPRTRSFFALARLKGGVSVEGAREDMNNIARQLGQEFPETNQNWGVQSLPLRDYRTKDAWTPLLILFGAVALVLLIACVNVANLLLQRGAARQQEMAVRTALGASPGRLIQQLLTESMLIALLASVVGLALSRGILNLVVSLIPSDELPDYLNNFALEPKVLVYLLVISVVTVLLFGLLPALRMVRPNLSETLKEAGRSPAGGRQRQRLRKILVVSEVALSLMLLIAAGLMVRSFQRLQNIDQGFDLKNTLAVEISLPESNYKEAQARPAFYQKALENIQGLPQVKHVGAGTQLPVGDWSKTVFSVEGQSADEQKSNPQVDIQIAAGDYFKTMGLSVVKGREFNGQDIASAPPVVVVNESVARRFWPQQDAVGKRVKVGTAKDKDKETWFTVVGVVSNTKRALTNPNSSLEVYAPYAQRGKSDMAIFVQTQTDPLDLVAAVRRELQGIDPNVAANFRTLHTVVKDSFWAQRLLSSLFGLFAIIALSLTAVGIYSTVAYSVAQRTHEIGVRMALGAPPRNILSLVLRQGMTLAVIGIVIGVGGALALNRVLTSLLFGLSSTDTVTFIAVSSLLAAIVLLATFIPARVATKIEPAIALRNQ